MAKLKAHYLIIILAFFIIGFAFYWYGYRPYQARKDCAWKREHINAITATPQKGTPNTQAEIDAFNTSQKACEKKYKDSAVDRMTRCDGDNFWAGLNNEVTPLRNDYRPAEPAQPEKNWWAQTSKEEYQSCLRGKGF